MKAFNNRYNSVKPDCAGEPEYTSPEGEADNGEHKNIPCITLDKSDISEMNMSACPWRKLQGVWRETSMWESDRRHSGAPSRTRCLGVGWIDPFKDSLMIPRFLRVRDAVTYSGKSRTALYIALSECKIHARKDGKILLIDRESLDRHLDALPPAEIKVSPSVGG